jgi:hypothetical protein
MAKKRRIQRPHDPLAAAREAARALVARRWPELADVEPTVTMRPQAMLGEDDLRRLGAPGAPGAAPLSAEYTFTFAGQVRAADGSTLPRVARITVDAQQRVVKATTSK